MNHPSGVASLAISQAGISLGASLSIVLVHCFSTSAFQPFCGPHLPPKGQDVRLEPSTECGNGHSLPSHSDRHPLNPFQAASVLTLINQKYLFALPIGVLMICRQALGIKCNCL